MDKTCDTPPQARSPALSTAEIQRPRPHTSIPSPQEERFYKRLILRLIAERKALGLTQDDVNARIGLTEGHVNKWEAGVKMPSSFYLMCWCLALGLRLDATRIPHDDEAAAGLHP